MIREVVIGGGLKRGHTYVLDMGMVFSLKGQLEHAIEHIQRRIG